MEGKKLGEVRGWLAVKTDDPRRILTWTARIRIARRGVFYGVNKRDKDRKRERRGTGLSTRTD